MNNTHTISQARDYMEANLVAFRVAAYVPQTATDSDIVRIFDGSFPGGFAAFAAGTTTEVMI